MNRLNASSAGLVQISKYHWVEIVVVVECVLKKMHEMKETPLKEKNYNIFESKRETDGLKQRISDERKSLREF